jgi:hypothetical protein
MMIANGQVSILTITFVDDNIIMSIHLNRRSITISSNFDRNGIPLFLSFNDDDLRLVPKKPECSYQSVGDLFKKKESDEETNTDQKE